MMYQKALLFNDPETGARILEADHPRDVKALGRQVRGFDDGTWKAGRERIVREGSYLKFTRPLHLYPAPEVSAEGVGEGEEEGNGTATLTLRQMLLTTGDTELVEASPYDNIWGIGFRAGEAATRSRHKWGLNLLGKALMEVRKQLREEVEGGGMGEVEQQEEGKVLTKSTIDRTLSTQQVT